MTGLQVATLVLQLLTIGVLLTTCVLEVRVLIDLRRRRGR